MYLLQKQLRCFLLLSAILVSPVKPQSVAALLNTYHFSYAVDIQSSAGAGMSGITFEPADKTLYAVNDNGRSIVEIALDGTVLREIPLEGFDDTEGIAFQSGRYFLIAEERRADIVQIILPPEGVAPLHKSSGESLSISDPLGNTGIEDVAWWNKEHTAFAVKEKEPKILYRIPCNSSGVPETVYTDDPFSLEDTPDDAAGLFVCEDGSLIVCNQEQKKLIGYSPEGTVLSEMTLTMTQPEGVTVDVSTGVLYVVGEPAELYVFKTDQSTRTHNERLRIYERKPVDTFLHRESVFSLNGRCIVKCNGAFHEDKRKTASGIYCICPNIKAVRYR